MDVIYRHFVSNDWVTLFFLICLVLIALMKLYKPQLLFGYSIAFFSQGFIEKRAEKKETLFSPFNSFLLLFTTIIFSLLVYFVGFTQTEFDIHYFGLTLLTVASFIFIRFIATLFIIKTLDIEEITRYFIFTKLGYMHTISIWLFPILVLYKFWFLNTQILLFFVCFLLIFRGFLVLKNNKNLIFSNFFYFILYFCTFEIAPLLIIYKTTTT